MIWVGDKPAPDYFNNNISAWSQLMPDWEIKIWTNSELTTNLIDQNYLDLINKSNIGAQKADLLRYYVVNKFGGYYIDSDITPYRSLSDLNIGDHDLVLCHDLKIEWAYIINAFFAASPNHKLLNFIIQQMFNVDFSNPEIHLTTGPAALGSGYFNFKDTLDCLILPHWFFYRNKKGDIDLETNEILIKNKEGIFGSHQYAATWVEQ
jgi:mannosyltransferase OCH1-like enzyme